VVHHDRLIEDGQRGTPSNLLHVEQFYTVSEYERVYSN
jgi:hypothetical protein|tara:strand:+ start:180 stop:293 length:114 start_codon:yes stop_codon:yes gene_type:complete